ncbi:MAG: DUF2125 domain-containing protein [Shimia sp.]
MSLSPLPRLFATTASLALLCGPAVAQVTPEDVWAAWEEALSGYASDGLDVGSEERSGDALRLGDIRLSAEFPDGTGAFEMTMDTLTFTDQGDGTVAVDLPATTSVRITSVEQGEEVTLPFDLTHEALAIVASGTPETLVHDYTADAVAMTLGDVPEMDAQGIGFDLEVALRGVAGTQTASGQAVRTLVQRMSADEIAYTVDAGEEGAGGASFALRGQALEAASDYTIPRGVDNFDTAALMGNPDFVGTATLGLGATATDFAFEEDGQGATGTARTENGRVSIAFGGESAGFSYAGGADGVALQVEADALPVPIDVAMAGYDYRVAMPLAPTDEAKPFGLSLGLRDLEVSDFVWNLFDPGAVLPRDPASFVLALDGTGRWAVDPMNPEAFLTGTEPGQVETLSLTDLRIAAAGAEIRGSGAFEIDNADTTTFEGFPRPEGSVDFTLVGANVLIDRLIRMGLLPQDQALGARMMLGLFATPAGDDVLTSTIAVGPGGQVTANGQRLR